jgi:hypothetical protein
MYLICELLTEEPEGACDMIPFETFEELYTYLAQMNCSSGEHQDISDFIVVLASTIQGYWVYKGTEFTRDGSKCEGGSQKLILFSIVQYTETL